MKLYPYHSLFQKLQNLQVEVDQRLNYQGQDELSIIASAPLATEANAIGLTHGLQKVACDGSTAIGRCNFLSSRDHLQI